MKNSLLVLIALVFILSCSKTPPQDSIEEKIKMVESNLSKPVYFEGDSTWTIDERMAHYGVPGVSIAVIYDGKIEWTKTYGVMDKESKSPVTKETLFQAGSISKPVAAYGALKMVEQGKLGLEEDINAYLKTWKLPDSEFTKEKKVTLKNLLNHSGGVTVHGFLGYSPDLPVPTLVEVLNGAPPANSGAIFVNKKPEESFRYSGGGYTIMQQMMMDVAGKPFPELMEELVLQPLGMNNSTYDQPLQSEQLKMAATGYLPDGSMTKGKRHTYPEMAAAGLWTNAEDLAKFAVNIQQTLQGEPELVLSKDMTTQMLTPFVEDFTGLGFFLTKMKDEIYFGHGGWDEGFSSELIAHKDKGYGVVVLTNSNHPEFISELIRSVALTYQWDDYLPTYQRMPLDNNFVGQITGRYRIDGNRLIEIFEKDSLLFGKSLGENPSELIRIADSVYVRRENNQLIKFRVNPESDKMEMVLLDPGDEAVIATLVKMNVEETIPIETLTSGQFDSALEEYQALKKQNPSDQTVSENNLNNIGYQFLNLDKLKWAQDIFKVNMMLYPNSSNVYDSYAEACMKLGELDLALENYQKSLSLDPKNTNAEKMIAEIKLKKGN
ncbi:MAG TPA: serine hydrolase [Algoriphagus sp.]|nr:serine hydrolase [Algoriphagus sp.]